MDDRILHSWETSSMQAASGIGGEKREEMVVKKDGVGYNYDI